jgi:hypothetical protein
LQHRLPDVLNFKLKIEGESEPTSTSTQSGFFNYTSFSKPKAGVIVPLIQENSGKLLANIAK